MLNHSGLQTDSLSVCFGKTRVLTEVSLQVAPSSIVGLAGRNGAGKTTLLRAISGAVKRQGTVFLDGNILPARPDIVARAGLSHVPEGRGMIAGMSVRDNLLLGCLAAGRSEAANIITEILHVFPMLNNLLDKKTGFLSGGQQQMVAIARGLAAQPHTMLVDELSLGLAPKTAYDTLHILVSEARSRQIALLIVDQNVRMLIEVCDGMYFLDQGCIHSWSRDADNDDWQRYFLAE